ncbi:hypothetical protein AWW68_18530 [Roseivirga spongicola]|uniref:Uncharacterized protein n=1 Tax=Roseivirga spongicola TaxID=333140 RepID=A0A150WXQ5_9BACT|nr:hypothetical protein AWW68_18530 [Roseivirga spongicola]
MTYKFEVLGSKFNKKTTLSPVIPVPIAIGSDSYPASDKLLIGKTIKCAEPEKAGLVSHLERSRKINQGFSGSPLRFGWGRKE